MCADGKYNMKVVEKTVEDECDVCHAASQTKNWAKGKLVTEDDDMTIHTDI